MNNQLSVLFDKDLEMGVIGALLLEKTAISRACVLLRPEMFYIGQHEAVATSIFSLYTKGIPIDLLSVWTEIKRLGREKEITLGELSNFTTAVVSTAHLENHIGKMAELYMCREVQKYSGKAYGRAGDWGEDIFELVSDLQRELSDMLAGTMQGGLVGVDRLIGGTLKYIESQTPGKISGIASGIQSIDDIFYGFKPQDLVIIAARPSCGKSAFALQLRRNAAKEGKRMAFFSLEMSNHKILQRDLAAESGIPFARIQRNMLRQHEWAVLNTAAANIAKLPMYMDDSFSQNVQVLHSKCTQLKFKTGLDGIIVDYLQLIGGRNKGGQNREQVISEISRGLKGMAKDLNVPVFALSQMSRDVEKGGRREPQLSDLRESGAIEQDADDVIFLTPQDQEVPEFGAPKTIRAKVAKHRDGALDSVDLIFDGNHMTFEPADGNGYKPDNSSWYKVHNDPF